MAGRRSVAALLPSLTTTITVGSPGPSPADAVWRRYATPSAWHEWSPQIVRVRCADDADVVSEGLTGTVEGPLGVRVGFRVTDVDEPARRWTWQVRVGLVRLVLQHGVDEVPRGRDLVASGSGDGGASAADGPAAGSRAWVTISGPLPLVAAYAPAARLALARLVRLPGRP